MDYQKAENYWVEKEPLAKRMPQAELEQAAQNFICAHNTCALATGYNDFVRCTPIEYTYWNNCFWLLTEGGLKFRALAVNPAVCLAIFDSFTGFGTIGGMQVSGRAEVVEPWSEEYRKLLEYKKIPEDRLKALPHPMYLLKIVPTRIDLLQSSFKQQGYDVRQWISY